MTDKELNKAICKELQKIAISLLDTCKYDLIKDRSYFTTGDLLKLYKETPWIFRTEFDYEYEVSVCVDDFKCTFCIGSIFHLLSKFEKLSCAKDTVFEIIEERNESGVSLDVIVGSLPENVAKVKITCYAKNGNDIVNRNLILTKVSDVAYVGYEDGSGRFDTYIKTGIGIYHIGCYSMDQAKSLTIDYLVSIYTSRIDSSGHFRLIDLKIIGDIMPERLNEANECRAEYLKKKEAENKEALRIATEEREKRAAEAIKQKEVEKEAQKTERMSKANDARLEKRLAKLVRCDGKVSTIKEYLHALKDKGFTPFVTEKSSVKYNRAKYNRMDYAEQQEYDRKMAVKIPMYIAEGSDKSFFELSKLEFDYFSSLFVESGTPEAVAPPYNEEKIDVIIYAGTPDVAEQVGDPDPEPGRNVVCIECEPEDVPDYWDHLDTIETGPASIDVSTNQDAERVCPVKEDVRPAVYLPERPPAVFAVERLAGNYTPERLHVFALVSRRFLITNKGMYYLIA